MSKAYSWKDMKIHFLLHYLIWFQMIYAFWYVVPILAYDCNTQAPLLLLRDRKSFKKSSIELPKNFDMIWRNRKSAKDFYDHDDFETFNLWISYFLLLITNIRIPALVHLWNNLSSLCYPRWNISYSRKEYNTNIVNNHIWKTCD